MSLLRSECPIFVVWKQNNNFWSNVFFLLQKWQIYPHTHIYIYISKWIGPQRDTYIVRIIYFILTYVYVSSWWLSSENIFGTKAIWMGHPMRLECTRVGLLVECFFRFSISLYRSHCFVLDFPSSFSLSLSQNLSTDLSCWVYFQIQNYIYI